MGKMFKIKVVKFEREKKIRILEYKFQDYVKVNLYF